MTTRKRIMTTTALGLLIAAAPLAVQPGFASDRSAGTVLAQAQKPEGMTEEAWRALLKKRGGEGQEQDRKTEEPENAPANDNGGGEVRELDQKAPTETPAPAEDEAAPQVEPEVTPEVEVEPQTAEPESEQAPVEEPPSQENAQPPATEQTAPPAEEPAEAEGETAPEDAPVELEAEEDEQPAGSGEQQAPELQEDEADEVTPPAENAPTEETPPVEAEEGAPNTEGQTEVGGDEPEQAPETSEPAVDEPVIEEGQTEEEATTGSDSAQPETEVLPENAAPVLDSQKEPEAEGEAQPRSDAEANGDRDAETPSDPQTAAPADEAGQSAPPPESDAEAQAGTIDAETLRSEIRTLMEERGERIEMGATREERRERRRELRQRREDAEVVREFNDNRTIIQINNQVFVESQDSDRLIRDDDEVYYEELPRGRVREVVTRPNGVRLVTVRNRYGDVIRRVRVAPDGREQVLVFVPEERLETVDRWRDPARDLPPLRLTIPVSDYILEAERVEDPDRYYAFLEKPPVEPVQRMYSLEEVKRSARVRDMVRRVDLDTIEFAFGSADIDESEIDELEAIATAIERMLDENPGETFLIEGHTDAVGSDLANLALSDRRAESVARALTDVFGIPPENLVTQGYGERYLKIDTGERERENRRVALRRITPLVAPVASAN
ncbi:OmpA family protein [uncultured Nitratireductor sp.]|uniref:OmpA family protein n=1 Tax=uncultured Nitratireductor sp. TaxID=520953 RepID=UPI0025F366AF|nr:OmpA family protein [uncultured Nitratireductor sp.]